MYVSTKGLVLRETEYKESSRILTVLTATEGRITVLAKGAKRKGSKNLGASQHLAYSDMTLFQSGGRWTLTEARVIELFEGLRDDLDLLSLGSYFAELLEVLSDEDSPGPEMLSLGLNALYALGQLKKPQDLVKAAFEIKMMCAAGFEPMLDGCAVCGKEDPVNPLLSLYGGNICCRECADGQIGDNCALCAESIAAMRYLVFCEPKKMMQFTLEGDARKRLCRAAEEYVIAQTDRGYKTLDYYKSVRTYL